MHGHVQIVTAPATRSDRGPGFRAPVTRSGRWVAVVEGTRRRIPEHLVRFRDLVEECSSVPFPEIDVGRILAGQPLVRAADLDATGAD
jgi:hypothetical protein